MTNLIPFTQRQSYHICLHPDCYLYREYSKMGTTCSNVWIAPAPLWIKQTIFSEGLFAGYAIGVYNRTGIIKLLNEKTYPLTIWQQMAKEAVTKAQRKREREINATRTVDRQIKEIESCFT